MLSFEEQQQKDAKFYQMYLKDQASRLEAEASSQQATSNLFHFRDDDLGMGDWIDVDVNVDCREHASQTRPAPKQLMFQKWNAHSEELMEWYIKSKDLMGEPNLSRVCANFRPLQCLCPDKRMSKLTLYFLNSVQKESPLTKLIVNNVYFLYEDNVNKKYDLGAVDQCLACEVSGV
ncbi:hypothetical protein BD560DRAFT_401413 [Blakeslea trispora]|nr:hypothetical protein BD560DRAFT_401413 [Blakeslea trispora]